jgi:AraC-like DNA-binding protein
VAFYGFLMPRFVPTTVVAPDKWFLALGGRAHIVPQYTGFTPIPEKKVMARRTLRQHLFYFVTRNAVHVVFDNETVLVERGDFLWVMPGVTHETRLPSGGEPFTNFYIRLQLIHPQTEKNVRLPTDWMLKKQAWPILPHFKQVIDALQTPDGNYMARVRGALMLMTAWILDQQTVTEPAGHVFSPQQRLRLQRYMNLHVGEEITPSMLADLMELSPNYFSRIFHRSFGLAPRQWIVRDRIQKAATLLMETELKAKEIAYQLGYCNRYLFSQQFKQVMGVGPRAYRAGRGRAV